MSESIQPSSAVAAADDKLDFKKILPIFVIVLIDLLGLTIIIPLLPLYAAAYGATAFQIGLLGATYPIFQFIGAPILGRLSDRYGRRPVLLVSQVGTLVGFLILGFAPSLLWIFIARAIDGLSGGNIATAQAVVTDSTNEKTRTQGLGLIGAAFGLGFILGPVAGGALSAFGYDVPSFAAAGLALLNLLAVIFFLPESLTKERREELLTERRSLISLGAMWEALNKPRVGPLLNIRLFYALAAAIFQTIFTQWAMVRLGLTSQSTGWLLGYVGLLSIIVQGGLIGPLTKRFREYQLIFWSTAIMAVSLLAWGLTPNLPVLLVVMIPIAFATGVLNTVINSAITRAVQPQEIGGALGIAGSLESLSRIVSPLLGSALLGAVGAWAPGLAASLIMGGVVFYAWQHLIVRPDAPLAVGTAGPAAQSHK